MIGKKEGKNSLFERFSSESRETLDNMTANFIFGLSFGSLGRISGVDWLPVVFPAMNAPMHFGQPLCLLAYGTGVAAVWADKIYAYAAGM